MRFEQYLVEEVAAAGRYVQLLGCSLLSVEDRRFVYPLFYFPPVGFKPLRVVLGDLLLGSSGIVEDGTPAGLRERLRLFAYAPVLGKLRVYLPLLLGAAAEGREEAA